MILKTLKLSPIRKKTLNIFNFLEKLEKNRNCIKFLQNITDKFKRYIRQESSLKVKPFEIYPIYA